MGEAMAYGDLPFPDTVCPVPDVYIYYVLDMINVWIRFLNLSTSHGHFVNNGLDNTERASFISD